MLYRSVAIRDWGTLNMIFSPAQVDFPNRLLQSPVCRVHFQQEPTEGIAFEQWLADELKLSREEAASAIREFVTSFYQMLHKGTVSWKGWGFFQQSATGPEFITATERMYEQAPIKAERVIRKGETHQVRVGEEEKTNVEMEELLQTAEAKTKSGWWIAALLLTIVGIVSAFLFATEHHIQWKNFTTHQPLQPENPPVLYRTR